MKYKLILILFFCPLLRLMAQESETITSSNAFSFELYKQLNKENENLFFSPISIDLTMRMLYEGAESKTKSEFEKTLGISSALNNADEIKSKIDLMTQTNSSNRLNIANALWLDENFTVNDNYKGILSSKYNAELFPMNFSNQENTSDAINNWAAQKTNNLIQRIIEPTQISLNKLLLTNAIYFNGKWNNNFDKKLTIKAQFYSTQNNSFLIDFMRKAESLFYWENDAIQYVRKSFNGGDKYICFLLPKKKNGISELDSLLNKLDLDDIRSSARIENVNLAIPKFKMDNGYELKEPLSQLGLKSAFTGNANFDGIAKEPLTIEEVLHKAHFEIGEEEVKAAATTLASIRIGRSPTEPKKYIDFIADHPFVFFIMDNTTNTILFIGKFVNQGMMQGSLGNVDVSSISGDFGADLNILPLSVYNNPLITVNGIFYEADLENFDFGSADIEKFANLIDVLPEEIELIEVLKDAATISKYGPAAANGVINIKTKGGKAGK